jgi:hypothetical protein
MQVEQNYQPTPFEQRPIGAELQLCQRYYARLQTHYASGLIYNGSFNYLIFPVVFPNTLRASGTLENVGTTTVRWLQTGGTFADVNGIAGTSASTNMGFIIPTITGYSTNGYAVFFTLTDIGVRAEL